ncbi:MAG: hypothetical protein IJV66_04230, partial [Firmicutes bacterium]|nr:hypothetical protein [Bacillota bacterium]
MGRGKVGKLVLSFVIAVTMTFTPVFGSFANNAFAVSSGTGTASEAATVEQDKQIADESREAQAASEESQPAEAQADKHQPAEEEAADVTEPAAKDDKATAPKAKAPRKAAGATSGNAITANDGFNTPVTINFTGNDVDNISGEYYILATISGVTDNDGNTLDDFFMLHKIENDDLKKGITIGRNYSFSMNLYIFSYMGNNGYSDKHFGGSTLSISLIKSSDGWGISDSDVRYNP